MALRTSRTDEMRVRDALEPLFTDADFTSGSLAEMFPGLEQPGFDHSVLSEFRARLAGQGRADAALEVMLARLTDAGLVKAGGRQRTDSSHVIACVRRLNRIETCGESLRAALEEIAAVSPGFVVALLKPGWDARYGRKVETSRLLGRANASAQALAEQIGADGQEVRTGRSSRRPGRVRPAAGRARGVVRGPWSR